MNEITKAPGSQLNSWHMNVEAMFIKYGIVESEHYVLEIMFTGDRSKDLDYAETISIFDNKRQIGYTIPFEMIQNLIDFVRDQI